MDRPQGLIDLDFRLRRAGLVLLWLAILAGVFIMMRHARPAIELLLTVLSPFIVSLIVAYIFNPIVTWLQRRFGVRRLVRLGQTLRSGTGARGGRSTEPRGQEKRL